tara:strand:- start:1595 stop:1897 length:303 start_codon:yes stop_codon:yes gene_type:complete
MTNPNDNEFDLDSFLNDDVETFSRSTTNSIEDIGVFDEKEVVFGVQIPNQFDEGEEDINGRFMEPVLIHKKDKSVFKSGGVTMEFGIPEELLELLGGDVK